MVATTYIKEYLPLLIAGPLLIAILIIFIKNKTVNYCITLLTFAITFITTLIVFINYDFIPISCHIGNFMPPFGIELKLTGLSLFFICLISFINFCVSIWSYKSLVLMRMNMPTHIVNSIFIVSLAGCFGILLTNDMFNLFVFLEVVSICTYVLTALGEKKQTFVTSFNYLLIGSVATTFYMFGIGILYILYGTLNFDILIIKMSNPNYNPLLILGYVLIVISLIIKIGLYPACYLIINYYKTSYYAITALLSGTATKVFIYVFIKIIIITLSANKLVFTNVTLNCIIFISVISIFLGAFRAIRTHSAKNLLAYSSISQIGTIMVAICLLNEKTSIAAYYMILSHAVVKTGLFLSIGTLYNKYKSDLFIKLRYKIRDDKFLLFTIIFFSLSLAGFPLTSIFWGKLYLLMGALMYDNIFAFILIVLSSILSFIYSWRLIFNLYYINENKNDQDVIHQATKVKPVHFSMYIAICFIMITNIVLSLFPSYFINIISYIIQF